jgi:hypothetical protein
VSCQALLEKKQRRYNDSSEPILLASPSTLLCRFEACFLSTLMLALLVGESRGL